MAPRTTTAPARARTLAEALRGWDDGALAALVVARPDLARPAPADLGQLAARAGARTSVSEVVDGLDTAHVAVVEALASLPEPVTAADAARVVHAAPATVTAVLRLLRGLALVWGEDADLRLVRAAHDVIGASPAGLGPGLLPMLTATHPARLRGLAEDLGIPVTGDPVATARRIAAAYADQAWTARLIEEATSAAGAEGQRMLRDLAAGPLARVSGRLPADLRVATADGPLEQLAARGLLLPVDARTVTLPREVGLHLRGGRTTTTPVDSPPEPGARPQQPAVVDRSGAGAAYEAVRRVELLLEMCGRSPPAVLRSGGIGVRDLRAVAGELDTGTDEAGLLLEVARATGLLGVGDGSERGEAWMPTEDYDRWRGQPPARRWAELAAAWLDSPRATALVGGRDERDRPVNPLAPHLERNGTAAVRRATLQVLADAGPGAAVDDAGQVVAAVAWARPRRTRLRDATVRQTLVEAATLGVLAVGALTGAGRALLRDPDRAVELLAPLLPEPVDHVLLQADLTAVAPGPPEPAVAHGLALLADVESRGGATVFRFSADSVRRALDAGWPPDEVHAFLGAHSRTAVPQPLTYLVDDTARRHGRLRVGAAAVYVRVDDPAELDTVLADAALTSLRLHRVAPTVALSDQPADVVIARLRRAHRAPLLETPDGRTVSSTRDSHRARPRRVQPTAGAALDPAGAAAVVSAMRAGERARAARTVAPTVDGGSSRLVEDLLAAVEDGRTVLLTYLDETGTVSQRVVEPVALGGGRLTAYDYGSGRTRSFTLHRISDVAAAG